MVCRSIAICLWLVLPTSAALAESAAKIKQDRGGGPGPTFADYAYGQESERQKFDFWQAKSDKPAPLVLMIHAGGWQVGDKKDYARKVRTYLDAGISVASINYRFIQQAMEQQVEPPVKACVYDAARALQTIRAKSREWNIDPKRIAATGSSAGACTSLWLALHDDLTDAKSDDLIARQSTRLVCAAVDNAQTSLDPAEVRQWMPNADYGGHAFGYYREGAASADEFKLLLANRDHILPWIAEYSPINLVTADDPPIYLNYPKQNEPPVVGARPTDPTHSAIYGLKLAEKLESVGVEVIFTYPQKPDPKYGSKEKFLIEKLRAK